MWQDAIVDKSIWYRGHIRGVAEKIIAHRATNPTGRPFFLFVDGFGCSGKSTLSAHLNQLFQGYGLRTQELHIDDFIHQKAVRADPKYTQAHNYYNRQFRYEYLKDTVLTPMWQGQKGSVEVQIYDHPTDGYTLQKVFLQPDIVILEGVFVQRRELNGYKDLAVYLTIERDEQLRRALSRGNNGADAGEILHKYQTKYNPGEDMYLSLCAPDAAADIVFDTASRRIILNNPRLMHGIQRQPGKGGPGFEIR